MADTARLLAETAALLADRGVPVERWPGWRTRGRSKLRPEAHVEHDTADPAPLSRRRMLDLLANGHGSLRNAICNWAVPRERPAAVLIAARVAWHAGRGSWRGIAGNSRATGTEIQRAQGQTITAEQWEIAAEISRAEVEVFGSLEVVRFCTHNEWTPRKKDPKDLSGAVWRRRLARPDPEPDDEPLEVDEMLHLWKGTSPGGTHGYWLVQFRLDAPSRRGWYSAVRPDELKQWQHRAKSDRVPDVVDATKHEASPGWFDRLDPADG